MVKYICKFCNNLYPNRTLSKHQNKCFLNPINGEKLGLFFLTGLENINNISRANTHKFTLQHGIIKPKSIIVHVNATNWEDAIIKVIMLLYKNDIIKNYELFDLLIGKLTFWKYNSDHEIYFQAYCDFYKNYHNINISDEIPVRNVQLLFYSMVELAIKDYLFLIRNNLEEYNTGDIIIDIHETLEIIKLYTPKIYEKLIKENYIEREY